MADSLRPADRDEVYAATGRKPTEVLVEGIMFSRPALTIFDPALNPVAIYGVRPVAPGLGIVWLLGTPGILTHSREFLRRSSVELDRVCRDYKLVFNCVDERNKLHIRWLQWLGFTFIQRHPTFGHEGLPFLEFSKITHV